MPGITVETAGWCRMKRKARSGSELPSGTSGLSGVTRARVAFRPSRVGGEGAGEAALVEGHARDHGDLQALARGEEHVLGLLVEDVVDDLHGVDEARIQRGQHVGRFPAVHADAETLDEPSL